MTDLKAESTLTVTAASPQYGSLAGVWTVSAGKWISTGRDNTNTFITLTAPLSPYTLTGNWTASSGRNGTFTMSKIP